MLAIEPAQAPEFFAGRAMDEQQLVLPKVRLFGVELYRLNLGDAFFARARRNGPVDRETATGRACKLRLSLVLELVGKRKRDQRGCDWKSRPAARALGHEMAHDVTRREKHRRRKCGEGAECNQSCQSNLLTKALNPTQRHRRHRGHREKQSSNIAPARGCM